MTTILIIINHFIIYVDIVYLYTRAAKDIKKKALHSTIQVIQLNNNYKACSKNQSVNVLLVFIFCTFFILVITFYFYHF